MRLSNGFKNPLSEDILAGRLIRFDELLWIVVVNVNNSTLRTAIFNRRMLICIFTGLASGMPPYVLFQLVPAWLTDGGVSLSEIGLFSLVGIPYT